jgi:hypothetical protein
MSSSIENWTCISAKLMPPTSIYLEINRSMNWAYIYLEINRSMNWAYLRFPIGYIKNGVQKKVHLFDNFLPSFFQFLLLTHNIDSETLRMCQCLISEFRKKPVFQVDFQNYEKKSQKSTFFEHF